MKTVILPAAEASFRAAEQIAELLRRKKDAVLAFACGRSSEGLFAELVKLYETGKLSFADVRFFTVAEYCGIEADDPHSTAYRLKALLIDKVDASRENCCFLNEANAETYDELISRCGGLDMVVLGVGLNGHIGFNEPGTAFDRLTHRQKLAPSTLREKAESFGGEEKVPPYAVTMGIKTIVSAKQIMTLSFGSEKAGAVFNMLYARNDSYVPAAFLQIPLNVTVYCDEQAAEKL